MSNKPNNLRYSMKQAQFCDDATEALKHFYPESEYIVFYEITGCKAEEVNFHVIPKAEEAEHVPNSKCPCSPIKISTEDSETPLHYLHNKDQAVKNNPDYFQEGATEWPRPAGHYILIEMPEFKNETESGIILGTDTQRKREQAGMEVGFIRAIGPTAYTGWDFEPGPRSWGVGVGDKVEFKRYEGHGTAAYAFERFHYIPDSLIVGVLEQADE